MTTDDSHIPAHTANTVCPIKSQLIHLCREIPCAIACTIYNIGWLYAKGEGVPRDLGQAREWMQKAAANGNELAKKWLAAN